MMNLGKKLIAMLLACMMVVSILPVSVFAQELTEPDSTEAALSEALEETTPVAPEEETTPADPEEETTPAQSEAEDVTPVETEHEETVPEETEPEETEPEETVPEVTEPEETSAPDADADIQDPAGEDDGLAVIDEDTTVVYDSVPSAPQDGQCSTNPFPTDIGVDHYRIPALITLSAASGHESRLLAAADARWHTYGTGSDDSGNIDTIISYSDDGGATWHYSFANYIHGSGNSSTKEPGSATFIDPCLVEANGVVYMFVDLFPGKSEDRNSAPYAGVGSGFNEQGYLMLKANSSATNYDYYLNDNTIYYHDGTAVEGYYVDDYFNLFNSAGSFLGNLFTYSTEYFQPFFTSYIYMTTSSDGGETWSAPTLINLKNDTETYFLVCPGRGLFTVKDVIVIPCYGSENGTEQSCMIYLESGSNQWKRSDSTGVVSSEGDMVQLANGTLRFFHRHAGTTNYVRYIDAALTDEETNFWGSPVDVTSAASNNNVNVSAVLYPERINNKQVILVSTPNDTSGPYTRNNGRIYVFTVESDGTLALANTVVVNNTAFSYSSMTILIDGNIGILYEEGDSGGIFFKKYTRAEVLGALLSDDGSDSGEIDVYLTPNISSEAYLVSSNVVTGDNINTSVANYNIGETTYTQALLGVNATFSAGTVDLATALYTFTLNTDDTTYTVQSVHNNTLYLNLSNATAGYPNMASEQNITVNSVDSGGFTLQGYDNKGNTSYLYFHRNANLHFDRYSTPYGDATTFLLYRPAAGTETSSAEIPGYVQVDSVADGGQYLIVAKYDGGYYVLYPATSNNYKYNHVAKVGKEATAYAVTFTGVAVGSTTVTIGDTVFDVFVTETDGDVQRIEMNVGETNTYRVTVTTEDISVDGTSIVSASAENGYYSTITIQGNSSVVDLENALYTYNAVTETSEGEEGNTSSTTYYTFSSSLYTSYDVFLSLEKDGCPNNNNNNNNNAIAVSFTNSGNVILAGTSGSATYYLTFNSGSSVFSRSEDESASNLTLYRKASANEDTTGSAIPGYVAVNSAGGLTVGAQYLIAYVSGSDVYVLYPDNSANSSYHVAKLKETTESTFVTLTGLAEGVANVAVGSTLLHVTVTRRVIDIYLSVGEQALISRATVPSYVSTALPYYFTSANPSVASGYARAYALGSEATGDAYTIVVTGLAVGDTTLETPGTTYHVHVLPAAAAGDGFTSYTGSLDSDVVKQLITTVGTTVDLDCATEFDTSGKIVWLSGNDSVITVDQEGNVTAVAKGVTTVIASVYDASGNVVYRDVIPVVTYNGTGEASGRIIDSYVKEIKNCTVYYSTDRLHLVEVPEGTFFYGYFDPVADSSFLGFFAKADDGYAMASIGAETGTHFHAILNQTEDDGSGNYLGYGSTTNYSTDSEMVSGGYYYLYDQLIAYVTNNSGALSATGVVSLMEQLVDVQATAGLFYSRFQNDEAGNISTGDMFFRADKLPTISKEIVEIRDKDGDTKTYTDGMRVYVDDTVVYNIYVTVYHEVSQTVDGTTIPALEYSEIKLIDTMIAEDSTNTTGYVTRQINDNTAFDIDANGVATYNGADLESKIEVMDANNGAGTKYLVAMVEYTVTGDDRERNILNTVDLSYSYSSKFEQATYSASAIANASLLITESEPFDFVIDFGAPIRIAYADDTSSGVHLAANFKVGSYTGTYGSIQVSDSQTQNILVYTPTTVLTGVEHLHIDNDAGGFYSFDIFPANIMFYEEDFATYGKGWNVDTSEENCWTMNSPLKGLGNQQTQIANPINYDRKNISNYGYDAIYANLEAGDMDLQTSSAHTKTKGATAQFTFTGTGFDILGKSTENSAMVVFRVVDNITNEYVKSFYVDTRYKGTYAVGNGNNTVLTSITGLPHSSYTVTMYVSSPRAHGFYFSGFRVYDTINVAAGTEDANAAQAVYTADLEENPIFLEVRDAVIAGLGITTSTSIYYASDASDLVWNQIYNSGDDSTNGIVVVEKDLNNESNFVWSSNVDNDFLDNSPKNELYLKPGQSIIFALGTNRQAQIAMRSVSDVSASYTITSITGTTANTELTGTLSWMDLYYDLQAKGTTADTVYTLTNSSTKDSGAILSITHIKISDSVEGDSFVELTQDDLTAALLTLGFAADRNGLYKEDGVYYFFVDNAVATDFTGLVENNLGVWYVENGVVQFTYNGNVDVDGVKYLIKGGCLWNFTGLKKVDGTWYYYQQGVNDVSFAGIVLCNGMACYVENGKVNFNKTDVVAYEGNLVFVKYGILRNTFTGLVRGSDGVWRYMTNGVFDSSYTGFAKTNSVWVYVCDGLVNFNYSGTVQHTDGNSYTVKYGVVQF